MQKVTASRRKKGTTKSPSDLLFEQIASLKDLNLKGVDRALAVQRRKFRAEALRKHMAVVGGTCAV